MKSILGVKMFMLKFQSSTLKEFSWGQLLKSLSDKGIKLNITAVYTFERQKKFIKD